MNRRSRTLLVLVVAVLLASAASFTVYRTIVRMPVRQVEVATVYVAVATESLPTGTRIAKEHVKVVGWPAASQVQGGFSSPEGLIGRGLVQPVGLNEPLTENKLAPIAAGAGLPPSIPTGMRALSVKVNEVIGVAGFTVPGTRVDVLVILDSRDTSMARVVVSNIQVLTAGTRYDTEQAKDGQPIPTSVVTLLVTPEDAERIALAQTSGRITLVLRNPLDTLPTETKGVRMASLMGAPAEPAVIKPVKGTMARVKEKPAAAAPPPPLIYSVEAVRGGKRSEEVVHKIGGGE